MSTTRHALDAIEIASPCTQDWNAMTGDEKRRFCGECRLHVHDLSQMTRGEADDLLAAAAGGRVCVRIWRRPDGRVLTKDCVTVRERLRRRVRRLRAVAAAAFAFLAPFVGGCSAATDASGDGGVIVVDDGPLMGEPTMGTPCVPEEPTPVLPGAQDGNDDGGGATITPGDDETGAAESPDPRPEMGKMIVRPELGRVAFPSKDESD